MTWVGCAGTGESEIGEITLSEMSEILDDMLFYQRHGMFFRFPRHLGANGEIVVLTRCQ